MVENLGSCYLLFDDSRQTYWPTFSHVLWMLSHHILQKTKKKRTQRDTKRVSKQGLMKGPCVFVFVCVEWPNSSCDLGEASSRFWQRVNQGRNNKDSLYVAKLFACFWQSSEKILTAWRPTAGCWGQNCQSPEDEADSETSFYCFVFFLFWANASTSAKILIRLLRSPPSQKYSHPTDIFTCCRVSLFFCCFFSFVFFFARKTSANDTIVKCHSSYKQKSELFVCIQPLFTLISLDKTEGNAWLSELDVCKVIC